VLAEAYTFAISIRHVVVILAVSVLVVLAIIVFLLLRRGD
jgi:hypothetical protein